MVSIIIINYKTPYLVLNCINSILVYEDFNNLEIIVVDNNSSDDSINIFNSSHFFHYNNIRLLINYYNYGFGTAVNQAVINSKYDFIWLLNSDSYLISSTINSLFNFYNNQFDQKIGCIGTLLINDENNKIVHSYGQFNKYLKCFYKIKSKKDLKIFKSFSNNEPFMVDIVIGANLFINKNLFQSINGFDEKIFLYEEEADLQLRLKLLGYNSYILPIKNIVHYEGLSSDTHLFKRINILKSSCYLIYKHTNIYIYMYYRFIMVLFALIYFYNLKNSWKEKIIYLKTALFLK